MNTILTGSATRAAEFIRRGGTVAFPTETVYGLGANVFDETAIQKIFLAKQRPADNPLIAHVFQIAQIKSLVREIPQIAEKLINAFFPAPLTLVLPKSERVPLIASAGLDTIGVRMPKHDLALGFLRECAVPLVAPSANLSGKPSPTTWQAVYEDLNGRIDCILQSEQTRVGLESTVVDCTGDEPIILRAGAITLRELQKIVPETRLAESNSTQAARSPGLRHKHYAPLAKVLLIDSPNEIVEIEHNAFIGLTEPRQAFELQKICGSVEEYAHELFDFFRRCDAQQIMKIYCQIVTESDLGLALMDRLTRAAENV